MWSPQRCLLLVVAAVSVLHVCSAADSVQAPDGQAGQAEKRQRPHSVLADSHSAVKRSVRVNTYRDIPSTAFNCATQDSPGIFADQETGCQVFHYCQLGGRVDSFFCPNLTLFNQQYFVCDWEYNVDCSSAHNYFFLNKDVFSGVATSHPTQQIISTIQTAQATTDLEGSASEVSRTLNDLVSQLDARSSTLVLDGGHTSARGGGANHLGDLLQGNLGSALTQKDILGGYATGATGIPTNTGPSALPTYSSNSAPISSYISNPAPRPIYSANSVPLSAYSPKSAALPSYTSNSAPLLSYTSNSAPLPSYTSNSAPLAPQKSNSASASSSVAPSPSIPEDSIDYYDDSVSDPEPYPGQDTLDTVFSSPTPTYSSPNSDQYTLSSVLPSSPPTLASSSSPASSVSPVTSPSYSVASTDSYDDYDDSVSDPEPYPDTSSYSSPSETIPGYSNTAPISSVTPVFSTFNTVSAAATVSTSSANSLSSPDNAVDTYDDAISDPEPYPVPVPVPVSPTSVSDLTQTSFLAPDSSNLASLVPVAVPAVSAYKSTLDDSADPEPYSAPASSSSYSAPTPVSSYSVPASTSSYSAPASSSSYSATTSSSSYSAPTSSSSYSAPASAPTSSSSYSAPASSSSLSAPASSSSYSAPASSSSYSAPTSSSSYSAPNPSSPYSVPSLPQYDSADPEPSTYYGSNTIDLFSSDYDDSISDPEPDPSSYSAPVGVAASYTQTPPSSLPSYTSDTKAALGVYTGDTGLAQDYTDSADPEPQAIPEHTA